jgi:hypothetical protein
MSNLTLKVDRYEGLSEEFLLDEVAGESAKDEEYRREYRT